MAKATITYNLEDNDDKIAFERSTKAIDLCKILWDMQQEFRRLLKYQELTPDVSEQVEKLSDFFQEKLFENNVDLDTLYN